MAENNFSLFKGTSGTLAIAEGENMSDTTHANLGCIEPLQTRYNGNINH